MNNGRDCQYGRQVGKRDSCDLIEAEKEIKQLRNELRQQKLVHIGFTNDHQVRYATEEKSEAAFYPDSDNECYIPVYMLDIHDHRVGSESVIYCENIARKKKISDLTRQNQELMAQVELLRKPLSGLVRVCHDIGGALEQDGQFSYKVKEYIFKSAKDAFGAAPSQCLAEVKAQAGRDAVVSALRLYGEPSMTVSEIDSLADRCADSIRQQAKGGEL